MAPATSTNFCFAVVSCCLISIPLETRAKGAVSGFLWLARSRRSIAALAAPRWHMSSISSARHAVAEMRRSRLFAVAEKPKRSGDVQPPSFRVQAAGRVARPQVKRRASPLALGPCHATCSLDPDTGGCISPDLEVGTAHAAYYFLKTGLLTRPLIKKVLEYV